MQSTASLQQDRFFALKSNGTIQEFASIDEAIGCRDKKFVVLDKFKEFYTPAGGYPWRLSKFTFFDDNKKSFSLSDNDWMIRSIDTIFKSSSRISFDITLSDPIKRIRRITCEVNETRRYDDRNSNDLVLVQIALEKLYEYSKFHNWEQVDLESENKKLKEKIELLRKDISALKSVARVEKSSNSRKTQERI